MSNTLRELAWQTNLPPMERFILVAMADHANAEGVAWPSVSRLSRRTGANERTIYRAMKVLKDGGHISQLSAAQAQMSTRYRVHPCLSVTPDTVSPLTESQRPLTDSHPTPDTVSVDPCHSVTQTVIEPPLNLQEPEPLAAKPKKAKAQQKVLMPDNWQPAPLPDDLEKLVALWPADRLQREQNEFVEYWIERGERRPGWDRTWRKRISDVHERVMRDSRGPWRAPSSDSPTTDVADSFLRRMERSKAMKQAPSEIGCIEGF